MPRPKDAQPATRIRRVASRSTPSLSRTCPTASFPATRRRSHCPCAEDRRHRDMAAMLASRLADPGTAPRRTDTYRGAGRAYPGVPRHDSQIHSHRNDTLSARDRVLRMRLCHWWRAGRCGWACTESVGSRQCSLAPGCAVAGVAVVGRDFGESGCSGPECQEGDDSGMVIDCKVHARNAARYVLGDRWTCRRNCARRFAALPKPTRVAISSAPASVSLSRLRLPKISSMLVRAPGGVVHRNGPTSAEGSAPCITRKSSLQIKRRISIR
jgi:hypothetical protein